LCISLYQDSFHFQRDTVHKQSSSLLAKQESRKRKALNTPSYFKQAEKCAKLAPLVSATMHGCEAVPAKRPRVTSPTQRSGVTAPGKRSGITPSAKRPRVTSPTQRSGVTAPGKRSGITPSAKRPRVTTPTQRSGVTAPAKVSSQEKIILKVHKDAGKSWASHSG